MSDVRVGIVGVGFGAAVHLPTFRSIPGVEVMAIADGGSGKAKRVAEEMEVPHAYSDWRDLVSNPAVTAVSVVTPPCFHAEIVCAALAASKHVFCEKPFGLDLNDANLMYKSALNSGLVNAVDFEFRMDPGIAELKSKLQSGAVGRLRRIDVTWLTGGRSNPAIAWSWQHDAEAGGGVIESWGSHIIDYVERICNSHIATVVARSKVIIKARTDSSGTERQVTAEDGCDMICELADGVICNISFSNCFPFAPGHRIEIYGDRGRLLFTSGRRFTDAASQVYLETDSAGLMPVQLEMDSNAPVDTRSTAFHRTVTLFVDACLGRPSPGLPDFSSGLRVRQVLEAIKRSIKSGSEAAV